MSRLRAVVLVALLLAAVPAQADPITIVATLSAYIGTTAAVFVANAVILATAYGAYALVGYSIYSSIAARNKAKRQAAAARAAYNAGLTDRNITALTSAPPWRVIYGRADTGGDIAAIFTTDKTSGIPGSFYTGSLVKADAYKHIIIVWSARQCQAINDIKIDGIPVGALDAYGWATGAEWRKSNPKPTGYGQIAGNLRSKSLPAGSTIISVTLISGGESPTYAAIPSGGGTYGYSFSGTTLSLPSTVNFGFDYTPAVGDIWDISYSADDISGTSAIRVRHHLGDPDQLADAELIALIPDKWTANHRLRGRCYSWITLDLERTQFQGGPPGITADISGALVLDPRTGTTAWSQNPALCGYDWLRYIGGLNVSAAEVDTPSVIAAANVCDESVSFTVGATTTSGPRYTCNGPIQIGAAKEAVLLDICEAMAGWASYGGTWRLLSGSWVPPVMDLTDADLHGSIDIIQAGEPSGELHNAIRGQYVPAGSAVAADLEPYSNATFITADGQEFWKDLELPFTNSRPRCKNIARISVEQSRNGLVIFFPAKMRAWPLQSGDRVRVSSAEYGFTLKTFRVIDWSFGLRSPVGLTLQEDAADAYDEADASLPDPTPNTDLPNPWVVPALASLSADSGTAQLQRLGDGTIISRVLVTWPRSEAAYMQGGRIEITWREAGTDVVSIVNADGSDTQAYLTGVRDRSVIVIGATAINTQRARSAAITIPHFVLGKSAAPAAVVGLSATVIPGAVRITRTRSTELDFARTIYRYGASFAGGTAIPGQADDGGITWAWPALGSYTIWAADVDTTGNVGEEVSTPVTVDSGLLIGVGGIDVPPGWINANAGATNQIDVGWWKQDASIPWTLNGSEFNQIVNCSPGLGTELPGISGPKGGNDTLWYCQEVNNDSDHGGGWTNVPLSLDPTRTYRFVVPIRRRSGTDGVAYWGVGAVENLNGDLLDSGAGLAAYSSNPYFAAGRPAFSDRWYLFIGHVYPAGTVQNTNDNAGIFDCKTGEKVADGTNFRFVAGNGNVIHRAYQFYANPGAEQLFGRPMVNLIDGTEPSLREYFEPGAVLNSALVPSITAAQDAADAAQSSATSAGTNATTALNRLAAIDSDGVLSRGEKPEIIKAYQAISDEYTGIAAVASSYSLSSSAYGSAVYDLSTYLSSLSPGWSDTSQDTIIVPAVDRTYWAAVYSTRQALLDAIASAARTLANNAQATANAAAIAAAEAQATADGKIETFYQPTAPAAFSDGDLWFDNDDGNKQYVAISGTWTLAADTRIGTAITAAAGAQATANGRVTTFYASSAPTANAVGDLWFNTTAGSKRLSRWSGSAWVLQVVLGDGDVGTGEIAANAATEITHDTYAFGGTGTGSGPITQRSFTVTPSVNCLINFSAVITASSVVPDSGNYLYWTVSAGGGADTSIASANSSGGSRLAYAAVTSFSATGGVALTFKLISDRNSLNPAIVLYDSSMRVEVIKR